MIADINESGRISLKTETDQESKLLKSWVEANVTNSESFVACCNNKKCAFKFDLKELEMIEQICAVCGKPFKGTVLIEVCPNCYV
jgi:hypothetical protein